MNSPKDYQKSSRHVSRSQPITNSAPVLTINQKLCAITQPETETSGLNKSRHYHLFHWTILFGYYTFCIPFKPVVKRDGIYALTANKAQKIICLGGIWLFQIINILTRQTVQIFKNLLNSEPKPIHYFQIANIILYAVRYLKFYLIVITKASQIKEMLDAIRMSRLLYSPSKVSQTISSRTKICFMYVMLVLLGNIIATMLHVYSMYASYDANHGLGVFGGAILSGRKRFFCDKIYSNLTQHYTTEDVAFGVVELLIRLGWTCTFIPIVTIVVGSLPLTFWLAVKGLIDVTQEVSNSTEHNTLAASERILERYNNLKQLTASLNSIWSTVLLSDVLFWSIETMFFKQTIITGNTPRMIAYVIEIILISVAVSVMAEGCAQLAHFKNWLLDTNGGVKFITEKQSWNWLLRDLEARGVGIGVTGLYQINYSFITQLMVFGVTVFVVTFDDVPNN